MRADEHSLRRRQGWGGLRSQRLSREELEGLTRRFTSEIINEIGPERDIPARDVGTNASIMAWIFDTYSMNKGHSVLGVVTGKPLTIGGSLGRGGRDCARRPLRDRGRPRRGGPGVRGAAGGRPGLRQRRRPPVTAARRAGRRRRSRVGLARGLHALERARPVRRPRAQGRARDARGLLGRGADLERRAAPARLRRARAVRARAGDPHRQCGPGEGGVICEGANGPVTAGRRRDPRGHGVVVIPDVLANAGGVVVSYFEWVQGLQEYFWKEEEVNARLNDIVVRAFEEDLGHARTGRRVCGSRPMASACSGWRRRPRLEASTRKDRSPRHGRRLPPVRVRAAVC